MPNPNERDAEPIHLAERKEGTKHCQPENEWERRLILRSVSRCRLKEFFRPLLNSRTTKKQFAQKEGWSNPSSASAEGPSSLSVSISLRPDRLINRDPFRAGWKQFFLRIDRYDVGAQYSDAPVWSKRDSGH